MRLLSLSVDFLPPWAVLNNVKLNDVEIKSHIVLENGSDKGGGLVATKDHDACDVLLTIPRDLILSRALIEDASKVDKNLQDLLQAVGPQFSQIPRTAIMLFLLIQLTYSSPDLQGKVSAINSSLTDYAKFLPKNVPLPTLYSMSELELLTGTTLSAATQQKIGRLEWEFEHLKSATQDIGWFERLWWHEEDGALTLTDWKILDAIYRSRGLDLPNGVGPAMVPVLDMANHASSSEYNARFELDQDGNAQLVVRDDRSIQAGEEITIMYGCGGACEMMFSYGFLERGAQSAREMFLDLKMPDDDPLKMAKVRFADEAPGVRLFVDNEGDISWDSSFVWWACVNEEDGLDFKVLQQNDGSTEARASWRGVDFKAEDLKDLLTKDAMWEVFQLRAVVLIQGRVEAQGIELSISQDDFDTAAKHGNGASIVDAIGRLRDLEMKMLALCYQQFEAQKTHLSESDSVRTFLIRQDPDRTGGAIDEDFS